MNMTINDNFRFHIHYSAIKNYIKIKERTQTFFRAVLVHFKATGCRESTTSDISEFKSEAEKIKANK